jgi:hypothetical protein
MSLMGCRRDVIDDLHSIWSQTLMTSVSQIDDVDLWTDTVSDYISTVKYGIQFWNKLDFCDGLAKWMQYIPKEIHMGQLDAVIELGT